MGRAGLDAGEAEARLEALEAIGWSLGLDRMKALCAELGDPQLRFTTVHVVGTNGKTSVARMLEGFLSDAGLRAGTSLSPHLNSWRERVTVDGETLSEEAFAAAADRVFVAAAKLEGRGETDGPLTQFEIATAIAFTALADAGVEVAAIEAGMGGRLDASNVLDSILTVLTSIGLDHVDYLGSTETEIATEKLAVLRPHTALLLGAVSGPVRALARQVAARQRSTLIEIGNGGPQNAWLWADRETAKVPGVMKGRFRRVDLAIAREAAGFVLGQVAARGSAGDETAARLKLAADRLRVDPARAAEIAATIAIPGRLEVREGDPPLIFDVAHNPEGAAALAEAIPEVVDGRPLIGCLAVLGDKDAAGIAKALAPVLDHAICTDLPADLLRGTARPGASGYPALELASCFRDIGLVAEVRQRPEQALDRLIALARQRNAAALVSGSHYLVAFARDRLL